MLQFFTPANVISSGWLKSGTDVKLITSTDRILAGLASSDISSSKFVVKDRLSVTNAIADSSYIELYPDGALANLTVGKSGVGTYKPLVFTVGGSERMRIATNGNVGIGISNPTVPLHVRRADDGYLIYAERSSGAAIGLFSTDTFSTIGTQSNHPLKILTNNISRIYISETGNVGIADDTPSSPFTVVGITRLQTSLTVGADIDPTYGYKLDVRGHAYFSSDGPETHLTVVSNGTLTICNTSGAAAGIYGPSAGTLDIGLGDGDKTIFITNNKNVQIGYSASDYGAKLYVEGTFKTPYFNIDTNGVFSLSGPSGRISGNIMIGDYASQPASSILFVNSTTRGFLPPRMTTTQRDAISTPANGLIIYNTTTNKLNVYENSAWKAVTTS